MSSEEAARRATKNHRAPEVCPQGNAAKKPPFLEKEASTRSELEFVAWMLEQTLLLFERKRSIQCETA